jgi:hypothetical protein
MMYILVAKQPKTSLNSEIASDDSCPLVTGINNSAS